MQIVHGKNFFRGLANRLNAQLPATSTIEFRDYHPERDEADLTRGLENTRSSGTMERGIQRVVHQDGRDLEYSPGKGQTGQEGLSPETLEGELHDEFGRRGWIQTVDGQPVAAGELVVNGEDWHVFTLQKSPSGKLAGSVISWQGEGQPGSLPRNSVEEWNFS